MVRKASVGSLDIWKELGAATEDTGVQNLKQAKLINIRLIIPNPQQPRKTFDQESLNELADSIRSHGLLQPLVVRPEGDEFLIVAGHRRYKACHLAGITEIPCMVREVEQEQLLEQSLIENLQREDINPVEEAECYQLLMDSHGYSVRDMAAKVHKSVGYIHGRLELLKFSDIAQGVSQGEIGVFEARELAKVEDEGERQELAQQMQSGELNRDDLKIEVKKRRGNPQQPPLFNPTTFARHWQRLRNNLDSFDVNQLDEVERQETRRFLEDIKQTIEEKLAQMT